MFNAIVDTKQTFSLNSDKKIVTPGKKYVVSTQVAGIKGEPFSAYFGVLSLDSENYEADRKILWLNDFSGSKKRSSIIFRAVTNNVIFIYRINSETPVISNCQYELLPINDVTIYETRDDTIENYDDVKNYAVARAKDSSDQEEVVLRQEEDFNTQTRSVIDEFHKIYYGTEGQPRRWQNTHWLGVKALKCPLDMWIYQEIIFELKPDFIIESGTWNGGSALFLATVCDSINKGLVVTIDINRKKEFPIHNRIKYITGSSVDEQTINEVRKIIGSSLNKVLVVLDSDHSKKHVLEEMEIYGEFVSKGSYLIVEDTNLNGHPVSPEQGPGPMEAVEEFLKNHDEFIIDKEREKFLLTFSPNGYLKKIK